MNILHIDSSILEGNSVSRQISADVMKKLKGACPDSTVTYRDLAAAPLPHLSGAYLAAARGMTTEHEPDLLADLAASEAVLEEFLAADTIVIGVALYNLSISSQLKAWIDRIVVLGKTFRYTADGVLEGLMGDKRLVLCISRGGIYTEGAPGAAWEHCETYLRSIFTFIGLTHLDVVLADGVNIGPEHRSQAMENVAKTISELTF